MSKTGVLLLNLGTPEAPTAEKVKPYLKEFLMDPLVVDIWWPFRWFLVNQIILRTRPKLSALAYKLVWTERGSPLLVYLLELALEVQNELGSEYFVVPAMRYGQPSIQAAVEKLKSENVNGIVILPLYPQYSLAATQSSLNECARVIKQLGLSHEIKIVPPFYKHNGFISAFKELIGRQVRSQKPECVVFSFHGVPERHVKKTDKSGRHCLTSVNCCDVITEVNKDCYRAQCFATARQIAKELNLKESEFFVSFQSRLGRTPWIKPYTDLLYVELAKKGVKRIAVVCPSFVADCLETLEEVAIRGRRDFLSAGGEELYFIPSLNSEKPWVKAVADMIRDEKELSSDAKN